ncbi:SMI1/KNR4 family protein [Paenibacillus glucanolyticus]|uniref:SMI1/KNR4 family protein n=1 Tax=Paenibacillus glucanolyticus TaxID=59843 RepID=UPI003383E9A5
MDVREFANRFQKRYPDVDRYEVADHQDISEFEGRLGMKLPQSFCTFVSEFSNGIFLLDCEPIGGVSEKSPCGTVSKSKVILPDLPDKIHIRETDEFIASHRLISLTMFDAVANSNDHWVFICEDGTPNNEYRLGFISQSSKAIVKTLSSFEDWLTIFWDHDNEDEQAVPVFNTFYSTLDDRLEILSD